MHANETEDFRWVVIPKYHLDPSQVSLTFVSLYRCYIFLELN